MSTGRAPWYLPDMRAANRAWLGALLALGASAACGRTDFFAPPRAAPPPPPECGNGVLERGEACEDGNLVDTDGCRADCTPATCGDGVVFASAEHCDDGNQVSGDGCEPDCALPICGDRIVQGPEETCDDGNADDGDACLSSCLLAFCGDGRVRRGVEACDDANALDTDACVACQLARCGDGFVQRGVEDCDDGNSDEFDGCTNRCRRPVCGDGIVSMGEVCDFGGGNEDGPALTVSQGGARRAFQPMLGRLDVITFYDYRSASSHMGFEQEREGRVLLYLDRTDDSLFLILSYGADQSQPESKVQVSIEGAPPGAVVLLADDRAEELSGRAPFFTGDFGFDQNTDGGVIGPLPYPGNWRITLTHLATEGIDRLVLLDRGTVDLGLERATPLVIESRLDRTACRTDCQAPRCGDGRLDPGELCDSPDPLCGPTCGL